MGVKTEDIIAKDFINDIEIIDNDIEKTEENMKNVRDALIQRNVYEIYRLASLKAPNLVEKELTKLEMGVENDEELEEKGIIFEEDKEIEDIEEAVYTEDNRNSAENEGINEVGLAGGVYYSTEGLKYVDSIKNAIDKSNENMMNIIFTKEGTINQNTNLDGFLFEADHANTFNIDAAIKRKDFYAENLVPKEGATYGKNSVDLVVRDNRVAQKYQAKAYSSTESTMKSFEKGDYRGQRKLIPEGQEIKGATDKLSYEGVESTPVSKEMAKYRQEEIQKGNIEEVTRSFKNDIDTLKIGKEIAGQSLQAASLGFAAGVGISLIGKVVKGEEIDEEVIVDGLKAGASSGLAYAVSGGLKVAVEKSVITGMLGKILSSNNIIGAIASSTVEIISSLYKLGKGEITLGEAGKNIGTSIATSYLTIKAIGLVASSAVGGTIASALGIGAGALATVGVIISAPVVIAAGAVVAAVGTETGRNIIKGTAKIVGTVVNTAVNVVKEGVNVVKRFVSGAVETFKNVVSLFWEGAKSLIFG